MARSEFRIPTTSIGPALARAAVPSVLPPLPATRVADLQLLVSELISDAVERSGATAGDDIRVVVSAPKGRVRVELVAAGGTPRPIDAGWSMRLLDRLASRWGYDEDHGPARIWFEISPG